MANFENKAPENVAGIYYVDSECINCGACVDVAPNIFVEGENGVYVKQQPQNDEEVELCEEALEGCPVESIGNDGLSN